MSVRRGGPRQVLAGIAAMPAPEPRAGFVRDLELRLGALIESSARGDLVPEVELAPPSSPVGTSARVRTLAAVAACAAALALAVSTASMGTVPSREVATGAGSQRELTPDRDRHARGHSSEIDVTAGLDDVSGAASSLAADGSPTRRSPSRSSTSSTFDARDDISTDSSTSSVNGEPATSSTQPGGAPAASAKAAPAGTDDRPATMELTASGTPARVFLSWQRYDGDDFAAYLVLRANGPDVPDHPDASGRTLMLLRIENADMTTHQDTPKVGTEPRYRVVVVRKNGTVAAKSPVVMPTMPLSSTSSVDLGGI